MMAANPWVGFIVSSDNQRIIAEAIGEEMKNRRPGARLWLIDMRRFYDGRDFSPKDFHPQYERVLSPASSRAASPSGFFQRILQRAGSRIARRNSGPALSQVYRDLYADGRVARMDFVFALNDRGSPRMDLIQDFQARGTPVALVQESIRRDDFTINRSNMRWNGQGGCDVVYAWGETSAAYYRRAGVSSERIVMTGSPRIDRFMRDAAALPARNELRREIGLPAESPVVLFATNPVYKWNLREPLVRGAYLHHIGRVLDWAVPLGIHLLIKPHSLEKQDFADWDFEPWLGSLPHATYAPDVDLARAISACDAVLVFNSTVALEAALLGKPSGMIAAQDYGHGADFLETGISRMVNSAGDLQALLSGGGEAHGAGQYLCRTAGSAGAIAEDALQRMNL